MKGNMKVVQFVAMLVWFLPATIHERGYVMATRPAAIHAAADLDPKILMYGTGCSEGKAAADNDCEEPLPFSIVGYRGLCLEAVNNVPKLRNCETNTTQQKWILLDDFSIRTKQKDEMCLSANELSLGSDVLVLPCKADLHYQRWHYYDPNNTIVNLASDGLVLDVSDYEVRPYTQHLILWNWHEDDSENQKWYLRVTS